MRRGNTILEDALLGLVFACGLPILFIVTVYWVIVLLPVVSIAVLLLVVWFVVKRIKPLKVEPVTIPEDTEPSKPYEPIMVNWGGKQVPLIGLVISIVLTIILVPTLIIALLLYIPPGISALIVLGMIGYAVGKHSK